MSGYVTSYDFSRACGLPIHIATRHSSFEVRVCAYPSVLFLTRIVSPGVDGRFCEHLVSTLFVFHVEFGVGQSVIAFGVQLSVKFTPVFPRMILTLFSIPLGYMHIVFGDVSTALSLTASNLTYRPSEFS